MITLSRRKLISHIGLLIAAPAIVRASSLMPVKAWEDLSRERNRDFLFSSCDKLNGIIFYSAFDKTTGLYTQFHVGDLYSGKTAGEIFRKCYLTADRTAA